MVHNFGTYLDLINGMYETAHKSAFIRANSKIQKRLLKSNSHLFSRWYHSTLLKGTLLSPANLLGLLNRQFNKGGYIYPVIKAELQPKTPYDLIFTPVAYNVEHHPVVADFRSFLEQISPAININLQNALSTADERIVLQTLSIKDPYYVEFFLALAQNMNLFKKSKGVHVNRLTENEEELAKFNEQNDREIFEQIVKESIKMCASYVSNMIPGYSMPIEDSFIENLLKTPFSNNDIMSKIYNMLLESFQWMLARGIEFEISSPQFDAPKKSVNMSEQDLYAIFTSGSYVLNALFVKHFFTTFGDFLKLIEPFHEEPFNFKEFHAFVSSTQGDSDAFYMPCSQYSLTPLAVEFFGLSDDPDKNNTINTKIPLATLFDIIPPPFGKARLNYTNLISKYARSDGLRALRLKIILSRSDSIWKTIELTDLCSLEQLHYIICDEFYLEPTENYCFNTDASMNFFTMYTPPSNKTKHKKTNSTLLKDLPIGEKTVFYYRLERSLSPFLSRESDIETETEMYTIEVAKINNPTGIEVYPRVVRESASLKNLNFFIDTDFGF